MSECMYCTHGFRDDNYGVCCLCSESEHYTRSWDLNWENISDCVYFDDERPNNLLNKAEAKIKELEEDNERLKQRIRDMQNGVGFDD